MRKISNRENVVGCQKLMLQASTRKRLLSAKLLDHPGIDAHRVADPRGEFIGTDREPDDVVHVIPKLWIVGPDKSLPESIPDPVFTEVQLRQRFIVSQTIIERGNGLVLPIARAVILTGRRKMIVWRPDGFYVGQTGDVLISWTFTRENPLRWDNEHFEVVEGSAWKEKFEIIQP